MSRLSLASRKPTREFKLLSLAGLPVLLLLGLLGSPLAQSGPGPEDHGPGRPKMRGALQGPPPPEFMRDSIGLSGTSLQRYTQLYQKQMNDTKPIRDSLRSSFEAARSARRSGERSAPSGLRGTIERQAKQLADKNKAFDESLKGVLNQDQQKRYESWKEDRAKQRQERWGRHHRHEGATFSPDSGSHQ